MPRAFSVLGVNRVMVSGTSLRRKFWKATDLFSNDHHKMDVEADLMALFQASLSTTTIIDKEELCYRAIKRVTLHSKNT